MKRQSPRSLDDHSGLSSFATEALWPRLCDPVMTNGLLAERIDHHHLAVDMKRRCPSVSACQSWKTSLMFLAPSTHSRDAAVADSTAEQRDRSRRCRIGGRLLRLAFGFRGPDAVSCRSPDSPRRDVERGVIVGTAFLVPGNNALAAASSLRPNRPELDTTCPG